MAISSENPFAMRSNYESSLRIARPHLTVIKRATEMSLACVLLVLAAPVILISGLAIRLTSRGPVFYVQKRMGLNGRIFTIYKLRTMYRDSEPNGPQWWTRGDRRVTPVGWFLRATHLDELPQIFNILLGDMSLVGPRPERPEIITELEVELPEYHLRHTIRPGVTGLAQVLLPPDESVESVSRKLEHDLAYIEHMNFWLDLRLMPATALHVLKVPPPLIARLCCLPRPRQTPPPSNGITTDEMNTISEAITQIAASPGSPA